jgi:RNA polymerase sigma-70 factor, ECF subfamily
LTANTSSGTGPAAAVAAAHRRSWGRLLGLLARHFRDLDVAEECLADAFARAVERWPADGVPAEPEAWLLTVARRRGLDLLRHEQVRARKLPLLVVDGDADVPDPAQEVVEVDEAASTLTDERLRLLFTCCHPALALPARVGLTLRYVAGLSTAEIAHAFLVTEPTMAARLTRAKRKIASAGIPYRVPGDAELPDRLAGVLAVVYLVFNQGYVASSGAELIRADLCAEGVRLARVLAEFMPDEPEALGLAALLLLHDARRPARAGARGELVLLAEQDRSRWDRAQIDEGVALLRRAVRRVAATGSAGRYVLEAAVAAEHGRARRAEDTDWAAISGLYADLEELTGSPVVRLNRAVAVAEAAGPAAGLALLEGLDGPLRDYHLLPAVRADLLRRLGRRDEAAADYRRALALTASEAERDLLRRRLAELDRPDTAVR